MNVTGKFMVLDCKPNSKSDIGGAYVDLMDLETKKQFQVSSDVMIDKTQLLTPVELTLSDVRINRGVSKNNKPYVFVSCGSIAGKLIK